MATRERVVLVGGGLTAARAAESLREAGFEGEIVVLGRGAPLPYDRPPLSKGYLIGGGCRERRSIRRMPPGTGRPRRRGPARGAGHRDRPGGAHRHHDRGGCRGRGAGLRPAAARHRRLAAPFTGPGAGLRGRAHAAQPPRLDAPAHRAPAGRAARRDRRRRLDRPRGRRGGRADYGNEVTVLGRDEVPLAVAIGTRARRDVPANCTSEHGVVVRTGDGVAAHRRRRRPRHRGRARHGRGGARRPRRCSASARRRTSSSPIRGARRRQRHRDGCRLPHERRRRLRRRRRRELVQPAPRPLAAHRALGERAERRGTSPGRSIAGETVVYDDIPYFYTDQYDLGMEYSGYGDARRRRRARGAAATSPPASSSRSGSPGGRVVAGMNVNVWDVNETVQRLIRSEAHRVPRGARRPRRAARRTRRGHPRRGRARGEPAIATGAPHRGREVRLLAARSP